MRTSTSSMPYCGMIFRASAKMVVRVISSVRGDLFLSSSSRSAGTSSRTSSLGTPTKALRTSSMSSLLDTWSRTTESMMSFRRDCAPLPWPRSPGISSHRQCASVPWCPPR